MGVKTNTIKNNINTLPGYILVYSILFTPQLDIIQHNKIANNVIIDSEEMEMRPIEYLRYVQHLQHNYAK